MPKPVQIDAFDRDVLDVDLFGRADDVVVCRNKMMVTRAPHDCDVCASAIPEGARIRAETQMQRRIAVRTLYACEACCEACQLTTLSPIAGAEAIERLRAIGDVRRLAAKES